MKDNYFQSRDFTLFQEVLTCSRNSSNHAHLSVHHSLALAPSPAYSLAIISPSDASTQP